MLCKPGNSCMVILCIRFVRQVKLLIKIRVQPALKDSYLKYDDIRPLVCFYLS